ncbi:hypothetical protein [Gordonia sp. 852002-10350_SCH5691597]|uniref:hypothetical protein n=1 Tax=Gordonia sp. 852002-10350_SCH5691597 TaxID=1834085 RepID=UPI0007EB81FF|nr:hypothetical protein [Gordonia sp. 852002-10350_SCH5691597]OBA59260.1 hypothetical protein A5777_05330 [Gordonia sp. 852002-10350_SCH5691597]
MGTFDELEIDGIRWQTKALGKHMGVRRPGDEVEVRRVAGPDDPADVAAYAYDDLPGRYVVQVQAIEYALVENGRLVGLATAADREQLSDATFDCHGRDEHDLLTYDAPFDPRRPRRAMTPVHRRPLPGSPEDTAFEQALDEPTGDDAPDA